MVPALHVSVPHIDEPRHHNQDDKGDEDADPSRCYPLRHLPCALGLSVALALLQLTLAPLLQLTPGLLMLIIAWGCYLR